MYWLCLAVFGLCIVCKAGFNISCLNFQQILPLSQCHVLAWQPKGDRLWELLFSAELCCLFFCVCLEESAWGSSQLQSDICFSLHLSEIYTLCLNLCIQVCLGVCLHYAGGLLVEQLMLVISVVSWSPAALDRPRGESIFSTVLSQQQIHTQLHTYTPRSAVLEAVTFWDYSRWL